MIAALLLAAVAGTADPCQPVEPAGSADPAAAEAYRAVGDAEGAAGAADTAAVAYREALRRDPANGRARAALQALCRRATADPFQQGRRLMDAGEWREAAAKFAEARAAGPDASAALLEGICRHELGEEEAAARLLREAERDPAHRDSARFFLGLVALRSGEGVRAASLFESVAGNPGLAVPASELGWAARRTGRVVLSLLSEGGYDSNVDVAPDGVAKPSRNADGSAALTGLALVRPFGESGPFARGNFTWRDQARFDAYDLVGGGGAVGWDAGLDAEWFHGEYGYDYRALGGAPYLSAHLLLGGAGLAIGRLSLGATYLARFESYLTATAEPYSGLRQRLEGRAAWRLGVGSRIALAYHLGNDDARDHALSWIEHGPRAELGLRLGGSARLALEAAATWRDHREVDPALRAVRSDVYLDGAATAEVDVGPAWAVRLSLGARKAFSNLPDFAYTRVTLMLGIAYTIGLF